MSLIRFDGCVFEVPKNLLRWPSWALGCFSTLALPFACAAQAAEIEEATQAKFQTTYVWQRKSAFSAAYSGANSLSPNEESRSYTLTATAFLGMRIWQDGELYFNPEMSASQPLSNLVGLGGLTNGENQKSGGPPIFYAARLFVRHTWGFGGDKDKIESAPNQLAGTADRRRLVLTAGKLGLIDIFDNNSFSHDPRTQFLNWSLMTHGAFDYAADQRGYSVGAALEYYHDDWVFRAGRFEQPIESNGLPLDSRIFAHYGDQIEIEHAHQIAGQSGKLRVLAFRNNARMGGFQDAINFWNAQGQVGVPDVGTVRRDQTKIGFGVSLEQKITPDIGLFSRASNNDGGTETYAFTEIERSVSGGIVAKGSSWGRPDDTVGIAYAQNDLSAAHRQYLVNGGLGAFIGDGSISYRPERIFEGYYSMGVAKNAWISLDYQHIANPAYNSDRGPVHILGARVHLEY